MADPCAGATKLQKRERHTTCGRSHGTVTIIGRVLIGGAPLRARLHGGARAGRSSVRRSAKTGRWSSCSPNSATDNSSGLVAAPLWGLHQARPANNYGSASNAVAGQWRSNNVQDSSSYRDGRAAGGSRGRWARRQRRRSPIGCGSHVRQHWLEHSVLSVPRVLRPVDRTARSVGADLGVAGAWPDAPFAVPPTAASPADSHRAAGCRLGEPSVGASPPMRGAASPVLRRPRGGD
jgi:hypothetical protein